MQNKSDKTLHQESNLLTKESGCKEMKIEFTIVKTKLEDGWMAQVKEFPSIMVYSEGETHLMEKLFTCIAGITLMFPHGQIPVELVQ